jgi:hypothetical protein
MKRTITVATMICALAVSGLIAQAPPNFAGKWTVVPDANAPTGGGRGMAGLGQGATITQDANTLTITRTTAMGEFTSNYKLDGSESKNTVTIQGNSFDQVSIAKWDAGKLKITTTMNIQGQSVETTTVYSLEGGNLVVETTRPDYQGGGAPITTKMTYKKS